MIDTYQEAAYEQRARALSRANEVRTARKEIKEQLATRELELVELITAPPEEVESAKLGDVLEWMPGIGRSRVKKILAETGVGPGVLMGHLSDVTRTRICARLEIYAPVRRWTG